ncbi:MAG: glycosyltransferase family 2 protein [Bacteroidales bacterium]|nr:glycosyltransferase family 2 protein [Bacteroidales bacterium]
MKIGVVILNYNSWEATVAFVEALQHQTVSNDLAIVIVDNASPNGSYEKLLPLKERFPNVVAVLQTGGNLGYAKGNNVGLKWLDGNAHPEYVAVCNNDIILPDNCLEQLVLRFPSLENACVISPMQLLPDGRRVSGWNLPSWCDDLKNLSLLYRWLSKKRAVRQSVAKGGMHASEEETVPVKVDVIPGSFLFASFERFKKIGFFYPGTFLFVEERFIAYAAKQAGYQNYILSDMTYLHEHSKTINTAFSRVRQYRLQYDGWLKYTRRCRKYGVLKAVLMTPLIWLSMGEMGFLELLRVNQ